MNELEYRSLKIGYERELRRNEVLFRANQNLKQALEERTEEFKRMFATLQTPKHTAFVHDQMMMLILDLNNAIRVILAVENQKYGVRDLVLAKDTPSDVRAIAEALDKIYTLLDWDDE